MSPLRVSEEHGATEAEVAPIIEGLQSFNRPHMPASSRDALQLLLRDESGNVQGGLLAETRWHWLLIHVLWVHDDYQRQGYGRTLLERAEVVAWGRGCRRVALDTTEFQARDFYQRAGYSQFGELVDYPPGSRTFYLEKVLDAVAVQDRA